MNQQNSCECIYHRYHCFHVTPDGETFPHSQSAWDWAKLHGKTVPIATVPIREYRHDLTREEAKELYFMYHEPDHSHNENPIEMTTL